jgi:hypothetical protein
MAVESIRIMRSSTLRTLLTALILALLLAPEALLLHGCACGRILDCCCRARAKVGESCPLHSHAGGGAHCSGRSETPASLQSRHEPVDRPGTSPASRLEIGLALAGRTAEAPREEVAALAPSPPVPPPRLT